MKVALAILIRIPTLLMSSELHNCAANKEHHDFSWQRLSRYAFLYFHSCYLKKGEHKGTAGNRQKQNLNMQITHKDKQKEQKGGSNKPF